jgi:hypothetical protein
MRSVVEGPAVRSPHRNPEKARTSSRNLTAQLHAPTLSKPKHCHPERSCCREATATQSKDPEWPVPGILLQGILPGCSRTSIASNAFQISGGSSVEQSEGSMHSACSVFTATVARYKLSSRPELLIPEKGMRSAVEGPAVSRMHHNPERLERHAPKIHRPT